jgi:hypothetical protein
MRIFLVRRKYKEEDSTSCGIAAAKLRSRRSDSDEEAQRRPAESEVPVTKINSPDPKPNKTTKDCY